MKLQQIASQELENELSRLEYRLKQFSSGLLKYLADGTLTVEQVDELDATFFEFNLRFHAFYLGAAMCQEKVQKYLDNGRLTIEQLVRVTLAERDDSYLFASRRARFVDVIAWFEDSLDAGEVKMEDLIILFVDFLDPVNLQNTIKLYGRIAAEGQSQYFTNLGGKFADWTYSRA